MCFFSKPSIPDVPTTTESTPAPVTYTDEDQTRARDEAADKARKLAGVAGTNKTSGQGLLDAPATTKKTVLGQ